MSEKKKKIKLKGNESFNFREGWLRKGMRCIVETPSLFSQKDAMEILGVGSKMVKAIKFWLLATGLCEEKNRGGRVRELYLTEKLGKIIYEKDPYFDDPFTLFILHYHLVANRSLCAVWNIFFNYYNGEDFSRKEMIDYCTEILNKQMLADEEFSESLFADDCASVLNMYYAENTVETPEDSLMCPMASLGLLTKVVGGYKKSTPPRSMLDKLAVLYVILKNIPVGSSSVSIQSLLSAPNNIGKVFNLNRAQVNDYLDQLRIAGYISISRTAGLDMVYMSKTIMPSQILLEYYPKEAANEIQ